MDRRQTAVHQPGCYLAGWRRRRVVQRAQTPAPAPARQISTINMFLKTRMVSLLSQLFAAVKFAEERDADERQHCERCADEVGEIAAARGGGLFPDALFLRFLRCFRLTG